MDRIARLRLWRIVLLSGAAGAGLTLLAGFLLRDWLRERWGGDDFGNHFPPGALADYIPEDSEAVLTVNVHALLQSPLGRQRLAPTLQQILRQEQSQLPWIDLLGVKPMDDLDHLLISYAPGSGKEPLLLARGRLDRSRIQIGPDKLQETTLDHYHAWEYRDRREKTTTLIAPAGDTLVVSDTPARVTAALKQASDSRLPPIRDATLRDLLTKVDRRQSIWLAASLKKLGPITGLDSFWLRTILRPVFAHAESVYGEIACTEDVRAELHFRTATAEEADKLEEALKSIRDVARDGSWLLGGRKELLPLLRLLGAGQISREDNAILLRCRLTAEHLEGN